MKLTTLCYIENDDKYLMLYRNRKKNDDNGGKWIGVGGKLLENETPFECVRREVLEETGLELLDARQRGIVTFVSDVYQTEYMFLFTATRFSGKIGQCDEGELAWISKDRLSELPMWEGDKIFLDLLAKDCGFFDLKLIYEGDRLVSHFLKSF